MTSHCTVCKWVLKIYYYLLKKFIVNEKLIPNGIRGNDVAVDGL